MFADVIADDSNAVLRNWEIIKLQEKKAMGAGEDESIMSGVPKNFPALMRAEKLQAKASRVGFDWSDVRDAELKVREEEQELRNALAQRRFPEQVRGSWRSAFRLCQRFTTVGHRPRRGIESFMRQNS